MIKIIIVSMTLFLSLYAAPPMGCDGNSVYDINGTYQIECAAYYLNMTPTDYSNQMALSGNLTGFTFLVVTLLFVLATGRKR